MKRSERTWELANRASTKFSSTVGRAARANFDALAEVGVNVGLGGDEVRAYTVFGSRS